MARTKRWSTNKYYFWIKWKCSVVRVKVREEYEHVLCHKSMRIHIKMSVLQSVALKFLSTNNLIYSRDCISHTTSTPSHSLTHSLGWECAEARKKKRRETKNPQIKKSIVDFLQKCFPLHLRMFIENWTCFYEQSHVQLNLNRLKLPFSSFKLDVFRHTSTHTYEMFRDLEIIAV